MDFQIGQIFEGEYPPEAATWCNDRQDCYIAEIEKLGDTRRFQIVAVPAPTLEEAREKKLAELSEKFAEASETASITTSLGFKIDANPAANRDLDGLILVLRPGEKTKFCDFYNTFHEVTREDLEVARKEIVLNGLYLYDQKWYFRRLINDAETVEALNAINIVFHNSSFENEE